MPPASECESFAHARAALTAAGVGTIMSSGERANLSATACFSPAKGSEFAPIFANCGVCLICRVKKTKETL